MGWGGYDSHVTHTSTPISLTHTPPAHSQTEIRITRRCLWVKNIIKVINLYLNRPLRVFPVCLGEGRRRTRFPHSLSALCNYVHVSSEIRSWRRLLDQVKSLPLELSIHTSLMRLVAALPFSCGPSRELTQLQFPREGQSCRRSAPQRLQTVSRVQEPSSG